MKVFASILLAITLSACDFSCSKGGKTSSIKDIPIANVPRFDADYAFSLIQQYEKFGPKVPGTPPHVKAGDWIIAELKKHGLDVLEQKAEVTTHDGVKIPIRNIIGRFKPSIKNRVLLSAHWDNRPRAENDEKNKNKPILGVNDGGSGVVVLLGIAKALSEHQGTPADHGVDFAFWDAEDWGVPSIPTSYCLGSQYWAKNPVPSDHQAEFGINFDMVGRIGSQFPIDRYSWNKASHVIRALHAAAKKLNYQDFFPNFEIGPIVDDHYFVSEIKGLPMIDLIYMTENGRFAPEWHTHRDTSEVISRDVLKVVAQSTLQLIYDWSPNSRYDTE